MSFVSAVCSSDPFDKDWALEGGDGLVKQLFRASQFARGVRVQMRFGQLSRAPLRLIRFQMQDKVVECDWLARSPDRWDADLSRNVQQKHTLLQSLRDAIDVRALLIDLMPQLETAYLRAYRESQDDERELIIEGCAQRNDHAARNVHSLVMRAKMLGFRFDIKGNALQNIAPSGLTIHAGHWKTSRWTAGDFS
jgi:hypothetical protein